VEKDSGAVKEKQPYAIAMADDGVMVMAGLWAKRKDRESGGEVLSCTILTCAPNDVMAELHDRMLTQIAATVMSTVAIGARPEDTSRPTTRSLR
jgi:putative SOS response-associated peptidase YedK